MTKATVLVIGSNATQIELQGGGSAAIGQYLNETVVPTMALIEAGYGIVLAIRHRPGARTTSNPHKPVQPISRG